MKKLLNSWITKVLAIALIVAGFGVQGQVAFAASITSASDNISRLKASTAANHEIKFVTPSGVASGGTITLTFSSDFTGIGSLVGADFDFAENSGSVCTGGTWTEKSVVTSTPSASQFSIAGSGQVVTITSGGASATMAAGRCIRLKIGTNATDTTGSGPGTNQITNGAVDDDDSIAIAGTFGDTGTIAVDIIADDQVVITATLGPSISFAISDNTIGFGALALGTTRYADGTGSGSGSEADAHTLTAATNATSGYIIEVSGPTLTSGGNNIDAIGATNTAPTPNTEQFGVRYTASGGSGSVTAPYAASGFAYDGVSAPDQIASATGATDTTTYGARYMANIAVGTAAGNYSTTLTYTATATF